MIVLMVVLFISWFSYIHKLIGISAYHQLFCILFNVHTNGYIFIHPYLFCQLQQSIVKFCIILSLCILLSVTIRISIILYLHSINKGDIIVMGINDRWTIQTRIKLYWFQQLFVIKEGVSSRENHIARNKKTSCYAFYLISFNMGIFYETYAFVRELINFIGNSYSSILIVC